MPEMITYLTCKRANPSEHNFCLHCNNQVECLNVDRGKTLVTGKPLSFGCRQPIQYLMLLCAGRLGAADASASATLTPRAYPRRGRQHRVCGAGHALLLPSEATADPEPHRLCSGGSLW